MTLAVISLNITPTQSELPSRLEPACSRPRSFEMYSAGAIGSRGSASPVCEPPSPLLYTSTPKAECPGFLSSHTDVLFLYEDI